MLPVPSFERILYRVSLLGEEINRHQARYPKRPDLR